MYYYKRREKPLTWKELRASLNVTEEEIRLEKELIEATIKAREEKKLTQRELSKLSGISQPVIARLEEELIHQQ